MHGHINVKFIKITVAIIKLFCRGILRKYSYLFLAVHTICLLVLLLYGPGLYNGVVIIFVSNFRDPWYEL
jgi:hypothetical protein